MTVLARSTGILLLAATLAACQEEPEAPPPIRPILSTVAETVQARELGFAGTVEPQYMVELGFQTFGRIVARDVDVGDTVVAGQRLAALDSVAAELAVRIADSDLASARAQQANAATGESRQQTLVDEKTGTPADLDAAKQARASADAAVLRAQANLAKAMEQLGYTVLKARFGGIVTATGAEVGQTVAAGAAVVTIARPDLRDAVVDIPDDFGDLLKVGTEFDVALQLDTSITARGKAREISPDADPTTRTRRVRIALEDPQPNLRLGTTITATASTTASSMITLPLTAILERDGKQYVWVVDPATATVARREVSLGSATGGRVPVTAGLEPGTRVATAGVHTLTDGQAVKLDTGALP